jgi:hypothetical protein
MPKLPDEVAGALDGAYSSDSLRQMPQPKIEEEQDRDEAEEEDDVD